MGNPKCNPATSMQFQQEELTTACAMWKGLALEAMGLKQLFQWRK